MRVSPTTKEQANQVIRAPFFDNINRLDRLLNDTADAMSNKVGVLCLTERLGSLPMWAHYTKNATGFVVEYSDLETVFKGDDTGILYRPINVRYEKDQIGVTFDPVSHESLFFSKFPDWSYEKEVRIVVPLSDCELRNVGSTEIRCMTLGKGHVSRIICGWMMSDLDAENLRKSVSEINPDATICRTIIQHGQVCLKDYALEAGNHFGRPRDA